MNNIINNSNANTKQEALDHYDRMIAWVEERIKSNKSQLVNYFAMLNEIGEIWHGNYCPYCIKYFKIEVQTGERACLKCELHSEKNKYFEEGCCDYLWIKMNNSLLWDEWLRYAKKIREYIERNG